MMNSMQEKLLTIAIPTYNGSKTISDMLDVLLPQVDNRVEIIISDNCSTDNTSDIIKDFCRKFSFITYIRNEINIGPDRNFLQCMQLANGNFTMLMSDDDIIVEGGVGRMLAFLEKYPDVTLAFLYTLSFRDKYRGINNCTLLDEYSLQPKYDICTASKDEFMSYAGRQWGFMSSFLCKTSICKAVEKPERFFDSYWLQSYFHILCAKGEDTKLGVICGPTVAAGGYGVIANFDSYKVDVASYKRMLDFACDEAGFDKKQLRDLWLWRCCFVLKRTIIKERAVGKHLTSVGKVFNTLKGYPYAWINLFPFLLLPDFMCKLVLKLVRMKQKRNFSSYVNRET